MMFVCCCSLLKSETRTTPKPRGLQEMARCYSQILVPAQLDLRLELGCRVRLMATDGL